MSLENTALDVDDEDFVDELKPDTKLMHGQYTIEGFLAAGGFGITYLARDSLNRRVVIKECFPGSFCRRQNHSVTPRSRAHQNELKSIVRLFSQEAMSLAKANHPNIVGVHQVFEENNTAYMALDFVQGRDLLEILQEDPDSLTPDLVESYLTKILDAIKHIHEMGILHRDISPDNVLINEEGEPILIDFGAARESTNEKATRMLSALRVVKDGYSPQEFYIAGSDQTPSCDLYSLAASFYHLITRELPPDSQWRLSACAAGDEDPYVSLGTKTDAYSKNFVTALDKAMSILPRDRMQNAEEWLAHMTNAAPRPATAPVLSSAAVAGTADNKSMMPALLGTTAVAAAIGGFFYISASGSETPAGASEETNVAAVTQTEAPAPAAETPTVEDTVATLPIEVAETPATTDIELPPAFAPSTTEALAPETDTLASALPAEEETPQLEPTEPVLAEVAEVTSDIAEPPLPAAEEATDFVVPPIISALPETLIAPKPRPLRDSEVTLAELTDTQPVVDTVAPAAPEPIIKAEPEQAVEPSVVAENDASTSAGVDFFVAMAGSQPDLVSARPDRIAAPARQARTAAPAAVSQPETVSQPVAVSQPSTPAPSAVENSPVVTRFVPVLPVTLSRFQPGMVVDVADNGPEWMTRNTRIVSINGQAVSSNEDINDRLSELALQNNPGTVDLTIGTISGLDNAAFERTLSVGTETQILLLNGLKFVARQDDGVWATVVTEAPSSSNFNTGDILVSFVSTWENLDGPNSLKTIVERELASGTSKFSFAVKRDGEIWVEAFNLAALAN